MATTLFVNAVTLSDAAWFNDVDSVVYPCTGVAGTNTITATGPNSMTAYSTTTLLRFIPANTNTGATTLNVSSLGAKNVFFAGAALTGGELVANVPVMVSYDGTQFNIVSSAHVSGTWTPVLTFATPGDLSVTYSTQLGKYTKIGNMVFVDFAITTSAFTFTTASGNLTVTGLPFTAGLSGMFYCGSLQFSGITKASYTQFIAYVSSSSSSITFRASGSAQALSQVSASDTPTGGSITLNGSIAYKVA